MHDYDSYDKALSEIRLALSDGEKYNPVLIEIKLSPVIAQDYQFKKVVISLFSDDYEIYFQNNFLSLKRKY